MDKLAKFDIDALSEFTLKLAKDASDISLKYFRNQIEITNKSLNDFDPVTKADKETESFIRNVIKENYPGHNIIGEEFDNNNKNSPFTWVIDPIDGTRGYVMGIPLWGTLIGLLYENKPVLGLMSQPYIGEIYIGDNNRSYYFYRDKKSQLTTRPCAKLSDAFIATTAIEFFANDNDRRIFLELQSQTKLSRYGGDCYFYALLAAGMIDIVLESGLKDVDILPLIPIIRGAGGVVSDWDGNECIDDRVLACGDKALHDKILKMLK